MKNFIVARLSEASTWRGLFAVATAVGINLSPDQSAAVIAAGMAIMGAIGVFFPDAK